MIPNQENNRNYDYDSEHGDNDHDIDDMDLSIIYEKEPHDNHKEDEAGKMDTQPEMSGSPLKFSEAPILDSE